MILASDIVMRMMEEGVLPLWDLDGINREALLAKEIIASKLEPVREARSRILMCGGYGESNCLQCDESGACMLELLGSLSSLSEEQPS